MKHIIKIKKLWVDISLSIALLIPLVASLIIKDWSIYTSALSDFATQPRTAGVWPIYLVITAVGLWLNGSNMIENKYEGIKSHILSYILNTSCTGLVLTAIITDEFRIAHTIVAGIFFLVYCLFIFVYGFWQIKDKSLKEGGFSVITSFLLLLTTLLAIPFSGLALFEISYIAIIVLWNWSIRRKTPVAKATKIFNSIINRCRR